MRSLIFSGVLAVLAVLLWRAAASHESEAQLESKASPPEAAPLCPWREPQADMQGLFPDATRYENETRILSGRRLELAGRLGRMPTGDENILRLNRIYREQVCLGTVLTRRVKGDYGAMELVLAVDPDQRVHGLRLQRWREPDSVMKELLDPAWQQSWKGKGADSPWQLGGDIPEVALEARGPARALVEAAKALLILLETADRAPSGNSGLAHHH
jgi:hypothetical protein